jgi:hypothetical protein
MTYLVQFWSSRDGYTDDRPTRAQVDREEHDAARNADRPLTRNGHRLVGRLRYEPVDHLAFDSSTTLCGEPYETVLVRVGSRVQRALCEACARKVQP